MKKITKLFSHFLIVFLGITALSFAGFINQGNSSMANGNSYDVQVTKKGTSEDYYYTFQIFLQGSEAQIGAIEFDLPQQITGVGFVTADPYPSTSPTLIQDGNHYRLFFLGKKYVTAKSTITFGVNSKTYNAFDTTAVKNSVKISPPLPSDGKITLYVDAAPEPEVEQVNPSATVTTPDGDETINFDKWNSSKTLDNLAYGTYTIKANDIAVESSKYIGLTTKTNVFSKQEQIVKLAYQIAAAAEVTVPAKPDAKAKDTIELKLTSSSGNTTVNIPWGQKFTFENLLAGNQYKLTTEKLVLGAYAYTPEYNGVASDGFVFTASKKKEDNSVTISYQKGPLPAHKVTLNVSGLPEGNVFATVALFSKNSNYEQPIKQNGSISFATPVVDDKYVGMASIFEPASGNTLYRTILDDSYLVNDNLTINVVYSPLSNQSDFVGNIYYHLRFPASYAQDDANKLPINQNYVDLVMSNYIAGVLYGRLISTDANFTNLQYNKDYLYGSLFAQLMQENSDTNSYSAKDPRGFINPNDADRQALLAPGQGGPYQINDYSKRLEDKNGIGLVNFAALQKSLGFTIEDQDSGAQTKKTGPESLDDKYFGPLAAAYFQYNDLLRLYRLSQSASPGWQPAKDFVNCLNKFSNRQIDQSKNFFDMIINATYNAGTYAFITATYIEICAHYDDAQYASKVANINNYTLDDNAYISAIDTKERPGTTFILYPRQTRFYLDELYNANYNRMPFKLGDLENVFGKAMHTLAYVDTTQGYIFISEDVARSAFEDALKSCALTGDMYLSISKNNERAQIFNLINKAIVNLETTLKGKSKDKSFSFGKTTEEDLK